MKDHTRMPRKEQSIRLFRSELLEALTHVHPIVPLIVWGPVAVYLLWRSASVNGIPTAQIVGVGVLGLVVWTLAEYGLHRFVFHFRAQSRVGRYLVFLFHGVHHAAPRDKTRLVMPPAGSIIVMAALYPVFRFAVPAPWIEPFVAFFIIGYLVYDYTHYATHHFPMRTPPLHFLKVYHLQHHYGAEGLRYGVSSPVWDRVFGTYPANVRAPGG
jgi:dihydroceramide fatty acyl 2-hydroxylase